MFTGHLLGVCRFSLQYPRKRNERISEKPYTRQMERFYMLWEITVIFTHCTETLDNYRISTQPGIYRWSIILADTDFFQQSVSVSAADLEAEIIGQALFLSIFPKHFLQFSCS